MVADWEEEKDTMADEREKVWTTGGGVTCVRVPNTDRLPPATSGHRETLAWCSGGGKRDTHQPGYEKNGDCHLKTMEGREIWEGRDNNGSGFRGLHHQLETVVYFKDYPQ